jgi:hypothetical protein
MIQLFQDGHKAGELLSVEAELARLTQSTYPAAQLLQRPLPDGVDPTRLELYLAPQHFQVFNVRSGILLWCYRLMKQKSSLI